MSSAYLTYTELDKVKWDNCINASLNGLIYAKSFYLDTMAGTWDAIVLDDYVAVMPLAWRKKWGIRYLHQPAFTQQGGIFFKKKLPPSVQSEMLKKALSHFPFSEIALNYLNKLSHSSAVFTERNNFILALNEPYEVLAASFDSIAVKNLKRAKNASLTYQPGEDFAASIHLYQELYSRRQPSFNARDFANFSMLCEGLAKQDAVLVRNVFSKASVLLATAILLKDGGRIYNVVSCVTKDGRLAQANYFLYDSVIREFAGTACVLDFEGSDVKGIATFYQRFAPVAQPYPFVKLNNLPGVVKLFKR